MPGQFLDREEYIEQEYFFRVYRERLLSDTPSQEVLQTIQEEILATTRLPMAIDFLRSEVLHHGQISTAMERLPHYFTGFQSFVVRCADEEASRFEQLTALEILESEARYRANGASPQGLFVYQFECIARNRLGYQGGLIAMSRDPLYSPAFARWIRRLTSTLGTRDLAEIIYQASEHHVGRQKSPPATDDSNSPAAVSARKLFGAQEGRIARANIGRDPMYFFAALQRQLGYPVVPHLRRADDMEKLPPFLESRLNKIEQRLKLIDMEIKGGIDLSRFYQKPGSTPDFSSFDEGTDK
jgi:hypothetical protein